VITGALTSSAGVPQKTVATRWLHGDYAKTLRSMLKKGLGLHRSRIFVVGPLVGRSGDQDQHFEGDQSDGGQELVVQPDRG
jgi:hypothetical protein